MVQPSLEEVRKLKEDYTVVPVSAEIYSDIKTPIEVLKNLRAVSRACYMLESVEGGEKWGRYSFLGCNPILSMQCRNGSVTIKRGNTVTERKDPVAAVRQVLAEYRSPKFAYLPPLTGGLIGYFGYEFLQYAEPALRFTNEDDQRLSDMNLMLFDKVIAFDHLRQKIVVMVNMKTNDVEKNYAVAVREIDRMIAHIKSNAVMETAPCKLESDFRALYGRTEYGKKLDRAVNYIREGDIFQAVLSNRFDARITGSLLGAYRVLRSTNPSPYMFYLQQGELEITGASPETLVKLQDGVLSTFPIAGTRPRGDSEEADRQCERELLQDEKELSEHNMLVDLGRNDLGRVSEFGSVKLTDFQRVQRYSCVMHITSEVQARLKAGLDQMDVLQAVLPAGTLSGAPKIRAAEIIEELEERRRGVYGGAIGYIDLAGNMDMCIAIRTAVKTNGRVYVQAGGGIVADSNADYEYAESRNKARAVMEALVRAGEVDEL